MLSLPPPPPRGHPTCGGPRRASVSAVQKGGSSARDAPVHILQRSSASAPLLLRPPRRCDVRRCRRVVAGHVPAARPRSKRVVHTFSFVFVHAQPAVRALAVLGAAAVDAAPPALHALGDTFAADGFFAPEANLFCERVAQVVAPEQMDFDAQSGGRRPGAEDEVDCAHRQGSCSAANAQRSAAAALRPQASCALGSLRDTAYGFSILFDPLSIHCAAGRAELRSLRCSSSN